MMMINILIVTYRMNADHNMHI